MTALRSWSSAACVLFIVTCLTGCIYSMQSGISWSAPGFRPQAAATCLLGAFPDGGGADGIIAGSGELVRSQIRSELHKRGMRVSSAAASELQPLLDEAKKAGVQYLVLGRITVWEDNATKWSNKRDHAGVSLELYEVTSGRILATSERIADGITTPSECAPWLATMAVRALFDEIVSANEGPDC